jgi:hypothetical protein
MRIKEENGGNECKHQWYSPDSVAAPYPTETRGTLIWQSACPSAPSTRGASALSPAVPGLPVAPHLPAANVPPPPRRPQHPYPLGLAVALCPCVGGRTPPNSHLNRNCRLTHHSHRIGLGCPVPDGFLRDLFRLIRQATYRSGRYVSSKKPCADRENGMGS